MKWLLTSLLTMLFCAAVVGCLFFLDVIQPAHHHPEHEESVHEEHAHDVHDHDTEELHKESPKPDTDNHNHEDDAVIRLTDKQRALIHIQLAEAKTGDVAQIIRLNGEMQLNLEKTANVMPSLPGFVTQILVKEGDAVKKGDVLAILTSHKLGEYYSNYNSALEQESLTFAEYTRAERLIKEDAISQKEHLRYKREYAEAVITRQHAEALLRSLLVDPAHHDHNHQDIERTAICTDYVLRAPIDGSVLAKDITLGENFPEDNAKVLFTISDLSHLWLELQANASDLARLEIGQEVLIRTATTTQTYVGTISYITPTIDALTRVGHVRVIVENKDGNLRPGQFVTGDIHVGENVPMTFVPREAVQLLDGETVVFVPQGDGFVPKPVVVGKTLNGTSQILSGLHAHDTYVVHGAFELKSILLTSGMDPHAGHGH